ncbi:MAG: hypothetical protein ABII00_04470 [Elusimicrobiota bacterium]
MKRSTLAFVAILALAASASAAEKYSVRDTGGFASTGRHVEFVKRYGWRSYEVEYDFGIDLSSKRLTRDSKLRVKITKTDGDTWSYRCRAKEARRMWANINMLYGKGISVMTECRVEPKKFAKAVGLDADLVGEPTIVFHVMIKDGEARAALHKGFYFVAGGEIEAGAMNQYVSRENDPSNMGVLFASATAPHGHQTAYGGNSGFLR